MGLLRRNIRKAMMTRFQLRPANVKSHINGSITFAVRVGHPLYNAQRELVRVTTPDQFTDILKTELAAHGHDDMVVGRQGFVKDVVYVTFTNQALVDEAVERYGIHSMAAVVSQARLAGPQGETLVVDRAQVDAALEDDEFDFESVPVTAGLEMEDSEL